MSGFALKIIALITMIIDHTAGVFQLAFEFRVVGRIAFPIYVFFVAEGFRNTKSPAKFLARLFVFAIISEPFFDMALQNAAFAEINFLAHTNIFYTLFLGGVAVVGHQLCLAKLENIAKPVVAYIPLLVAMVIAHGLRTDYGFYGVAFIFAMYIIQHKYLRLVAMALLCVWQFNWVFINAISGGYAPFVAWLLIPVSLISVVLVALYNGKRGPSLKWFFYVSYPLHLGMLLVVRMWITTT